MQHKNGLKNDIPDLSTKNVAHIFLWPSSKAPVQDVLQRWLLFLQQSNVTHYSQPDQQLQTSRDFGRIRSTTVDPQPPGRLGLVDLDEGQDLATSRYGRVQAAKQRATTLKLSTCLSATAEGTKKRSSVPLPDFQLPRDVLDQQPRPELLLCLSRLVAAGPHRRMSHHISIQPGETRPTATRTTATTL